MRTIVELFNFGLLQFTAFASHFTLHLDRILLCLQRPGVHHERIRRVEVSGFWFCLGAKKEV